MMQFTNLYKPSHIFTYNHVIDEILKKRLQKDLKITLKKVSIRRYIKMR